MLLPEIDDKYVRSAYIDWELAFRKKNNAIFRSSLTRNLYHYTNIDGLIGILGSNCLWASNVNFINDSTEYNFGFTVFLEVLEQIDERIKSEILKNCLKEMSLVVPELQANTYCISFCENKDLLSQWRGYAHGPTGFSIGFRNENFVIGKKVNKGAMVFQEEPLKVMYDKNKISKFIMNLIFELDYYLLNKYNGKIISKEVDAVKKACFQICNYFPFFKNAAFQEENEWRIAFSLTDKEKEYFEINYRPRGNVLLPYVCLQELDICVDEDCRASKLEVDKLPIDEIIVGPSSDQGLTISSLQYFLNQSHWSEIATSKSEIPFRK